jgi:hypothetical protein
MQRITLDLVRLAVSAAVACAVVGAASQGGVRHRGQFANAKFRILPPSHAKAISVGAPAMCWTTNAPIDAPAAQAAQTERAAGRQSCASAPPPLRRRSEAQSLLAFAR